MSGYWRIGEGKCAVVLLMVGLVLAVGQRASAAAYGMPVSDENPMEAGINGSRSVAAGELTSTTAGHWASASIAWDITQSGNTLTYEYTFANFEGPGPLNQAISHVLFDLTDDAVGQDALVDPDAVTDVRLNGGMVSGSSLFFGEFDQHANPGVIGFKLEDFPEEDPEGVFADPITVTFDSNRVPVWGDIFVKGGQSDLQNALFGNRMSDDVSGYVARPNSVIPLPAAVWPGLAVLGGMMAGYRRRRLAARHPG